MRAELPTTPAGMRAPVMLVDGTYFDAGRPYGSVVPEPGVLGHALARINRFAGHAAITTNVAHHSLVVASFALARHASPPVVLACLLHDVAEAFIGDIPAPVKAILGGEVELLEQEIRDAIASAYGAPLWALRDDAVRECDRLALAVEASHVLNAPPGHIEKHWGYPSPDDAPTGDVLDEAFRRLGLKRSLNPVHLDYVQASAAAWTNAVLLYRDQVRGS